MESFHEVRAQLHGLGAQPTQQFLNNESLRGSQSRTAEREEEGLLNPIFNQVPPNFFLIGALQEISFE